MATFKALVRKDMQRGDKTWNVLICFRHGGKARYIPTTMYVTKKDMTASFRLKNQQVVDRCDDIIRVYRKRLMGLNLELNDMSIDSIVSAITEKSASGGLSFSAYCGRWLAEAQIKGAKNYKSALNALKAFFGRDTIFFSEITARAMKEFEKSLGDRPRACSLYTNAIAKMFEDGREYYNDEDNGIVRVKNSLRKYHAPRQNVARKRALDLGTVRRIFALPYDDAMAKGVSGRRDLALDCFRLSFGLMGMNSADMYSAARLEGDVIVYNRAKTRDRRSDKAEMRVRIHPKMMPLVEKYRGDTGHVQLL